MVSPAQEHWHLKELKTISKLLPRSHKPSARLSPLTTLSLSLLPEPMASSSSSVVSNLSLLREALPTTHPKEKDLA